ncbi:unnamed protein product [Adineta ricciae]|uniref:Uncharacterized protein n=1 Tax=Adineta ricciae TaxID=249248 RepID=A0A815VAQ9_ADIRI|nr:unnamed protein product [Adineta ricciae]
MQYRSTNGGESHNAISGPHRLSTVVIFICLIFLPSINSFLFIMETDDICLPSNINILKGKIFYDFLETTFGTNIKEFARLQGFSSAHSLLHSPRNLLDFVQIDSNGPNLIAIKKIAAFYDKNGVWTVKAGLQYDADCLISALRQSNQQQTTTHLNDSILVSSAILSRFPWLKTLIVFCRNSMSLTDRHDLTFLSTFIENIANNVTKSSKHNRFSHLVQQFAFVLYVLDGRQAYEFACINLPDSLPCPSTISNLLKQINDHLMEGEFRFSTLGHYSASLDVKYAFASEDCTGIIKKICYDRQSNSFAGFCPSLQRDGLPRPFPFRTESFAELESKFKSETLSSLINVHVIQPITSRSARLPPSVLCAYGTNNRSDSYHLIYRWLKIFDESLRHGVRIVGFATDCDQRYLRSMRLLTNFFASLPNWDFRDRSNVFKVDLPAKWKWFYLDPVQLFVVFQRNEKKDTTISDHGVRNLWPCQHSEAQNSIISRTQKSLIVFGTFSGSHSPSNEGPQQSAFFHSNVAYGKSVGVNGYFTRDSSDIIETIPWTSIVRSESSRPSEFLNPLEKLNLFQQINNEHEQATPPVLRFPIHHKNKHAPSSVNRTSPTKLPTKKEIEQTVWQAFDRTTDYIEQVGVMAALTKDKPYNIARISNSARSLSENKEILDTFSQEGDDDDLIGIIRYQEDADSVEQNSTSNSSQMVSFVIYLVRIQSTFYGEHCLFQVLLHLTLFQENGNTQSH